MKPTAVTIAALALAALAFCAPVGASPGDVLYDQYDHAGTIGAGSQNFEAALDPYAFAPGDRGGAVSQAGAEAGNGQAPGLPGEPDGRSQVSRLKAEADGGCRRAPRVRFISNGLLGFYVRTV